MSDCLRFRSILLTILTVSLLSVYSYPQADLKGYKFDQFDPKAEDTILFETKAKTFLQALSSSGPDTVGYVNLFRGDPLARTLIQFAGKDLARRLVLESFEVRNGNFPKVIEFWIVGKDSEGPFEVACGGCVCPSLMVSGKDNLVGSDVELIFIAQVSGKFDLRFNWITKGGEIVKGQGTPRITVRPYFDADVTATVEVDGIDRGCNCPNTASFTTARD